MKKHLNTLYVTTQGAYLSKEGETVVVKVDGDVRLRLPVHTIWRHRLFRQRRVQPLSYGVLRREPGGPELPDASTDDFWRGSRGRYRETCC